MPRLAMLLLGAAVVAAAFSAEAQRPKIPALIASPDEGSGPVWVSASSLAGTDGSIDVSRVSGRARTTLETYLRDSKEQACFGGIVGGATASAAADRTVVSGTIVGIEPGFYLGNPGALLQLRVADSDRTVLIFYPRAEFTIAGRSFCAGSRGMHTARIGQRAALVLDRPVPAGAPFIYPGDRELYFEADGGAIVNRRGPAREAEHLSFTDFVAGQAARRTK